METTHSLSRRASPRARVDAAASAVVLDAVARRALWIAVRMIHEANVIRANEDGLKVGGHQASSASVASLLTTLYLRWVGPDDLVAVKPHASPIHHALAYLLGGLEETYLTRLRALGGLQAYPSRTKDPDRVDFSTGSVGLGAVAPLFAALADRYLGLHADPREVRPDRRFVAVVGDAELDEGSVWEAAVEPALAGLGNVTLVVDLNRQSLDRIIPGIRVQRLAGMFQAAGWQVLEAKYGHRLAAAMDAPGGRALRRRIDEMANEEYQVLIRRNGSTARAACIDGAPSADRDAIATALRGVADDDVPAVLADLGGHDPDVIARSLAQADADRSRPAVVFAYTVKGWRLPFAGDSLNHSALLTSEQVDALAPSLGADPENPWARFPPESPEGRLLAERATTLDLRRPERRRRGLPMGADAITIPDVRVAARTSTQAAFGDALAALAKVPNLAPHVVTASPDVTISTGLGGWVNRVGVFAPEESRVFDEGPKLLTWAPKPVGQHIELGISEMNLFLLLGQFGVTAELFDAPLIPIGTVYDPFIARGLDALIYALYIGSRFIVVGTPSGITLAPEGGAHQSAITTSLGVELPGLRAWEPAFAQEVVWLLEEAIRGVTAPADGWSSYLRLSTRSVDQSHADAIRERVGNDAWRADAIAGGYRLLVAADQPAVPKGAPAVTVVASGPVVSEACAAVRELWREEIAADLVVVTSAERLSAELHEARLGGARAGRGGIELGHLERLFPGRHRHAPIVTAHDGASHALSFLGGAFGAPVVPLGADAFGQSGRIADLYADAGIDADHIVDAAILALDLERR